MFDLYSLYSEAGHDPARINHAASTERDRLQAVIYARLGLEPSVGAYQDSTYTFVHNVNVSTMINGNYVYVGYRDDTREVFVTVNGGHLTNRDRKATTLFRKASEMADTLHEYLDAYWSAERARAEMNPYRGHKFVHPFFPETEKPTS